jgi:hypothetical protein
VVVAVVLVVEKVRAMVLVLGGGECLLLMVEVEVIPDGKGERVPGRCAWCPTGVAMQGMAAG